MQDIIGIDREHGRGATEQDSEKVEGDSAKQVTPPPQEGNASKERFEAHWRTAA